ncbi:MAG: QueT transporter family protein [Firmicutes bacterium]|nr:QueT transporter family protein [Bacillota bacterium]
MKLSPRRLVRIALVAAVYAVLTLAPPFSSLSYGPVQVRVSEALTVLPFLTRDAIPGLWAGCILANLASPFLVYDLTLGAGATLAAAYLTSRMPRDLAAPLPPVIINSLVVSAYVSKLSDMPYLPVALNIAIGEAIACYALGYPLLRFLGRNPGARRFFEGE